MQRTKPPLSGGRCGMGAMDELIDPGVVTQLSDALRSAAPSLELP